MACLAACEPLADVLCGPLASLVCQQWGRSVPALLRLGKARCVLLSRLALSSALQLNPVRRAAQHNVLAAAHCALQWRLCLTVCMRVIVPPTAVAVELSDWRVHVQRGCAYRALACPCLTSTRTGCVVAAAVGQRGAQCVVGHSGQGKGIIRRCQEVPFSRYPCGDQKGPFKGSLGVGSNAA